MAVGLQFPPFLHPGDTILVVAPASAARAGEVAEGICFLEERGFRVECGPNTRTAWGSFADSDAARLADLQWALDHPRARAVLATRGGYGTGRILPRISWEGFIRHPKWCIGFSDLTLLHLELQMRGYCSLHGPMLVHAARPLQQPAVTLQWDFLSGAAGRFGYPIRAVRPPAGPGQGRLTGGNLAMLASRCGAFPFPDGSVLFLEEVGEKYYRIDRMLDQLRHSGLFSRLSGVVLGQFTDCPRDDFPLGLAEMLLEKMEPGSFLLEGLESGHGTPGFPLVLGGGCHWSAGGDEGWIFGQSRETAPIS